jgi:hypothetical protein
MILPDRRGGRRRSVTVREVLNGISGPAVMEGAAQGSPPKSDGARLLDLWNWDSTLERIHHALYVAVREEEGREASPTLAIIDSKTRTALKGV